MSKLKIWLDDKRPAPEGWMAENDVRLALHFIKNSAVEEISLDHDLGDENEYTGYDVLKKIEQWLAERYITPSCVPIIRIHTANPVGRQNMLAALESIQRLIAAWEPLTPQKES